VFHLMVFYVAMLWGSSSTILSWVTLYDGFVVITCVRYWTLIVFITSQKNSTKVS